MSYEIDLKAFIDGLHNGEGGLTEVLPSGARLVGSGDQAVLPVLERSAGNQQTS
ncbi:hypothetical protein C8D87_12112 [Lentzea atacamensis]|uniref:Uncharacterized protein n=1 Tax=Lentzea atacamensis TaxID=531938 RepID=A0ABX9DUT9_9PSEU|nr:hypothetical protein [Lentzea atacamensis]RAS57829.1 hypothetical protein C8D87_12112 [Lentzea atacamensis]